MKNVNVVFMGTPEFSIPVLKMLIEKCNVVLVVTQPDKCVGRKKELVPSPVKKLAMESEIEVFQPKRIRKDFDRLKSLDIDLIVTCAFGQILPKEVLDMPHLGAINVHASLLPKYRGCAPIEYAIFNGDASTGVTIMYMDEGMDTGDMILSKEIPILDTDDSGSLHEKLSVLGAEALEESLPEIIEGSAKRIKQSDDYTLAPMIKREDERIDFNNTGSAIINKIRGLRPNILANILVDNQEIKIVDAYFVSKKVNRVGVITEVDKKTLGITCADGIIYLTKVKPSGKNTMDIKNYLNGKDIENLENSKIN